MKTEEIRSFWKEYRPVVLIVLLGLLLFLLPTGSGGKERKSADYSDKEEKLAEVLSRMEGVGECRVLLRENGKNEKGGAVIVCEGADSPGVCLAVKKAVAAYTDLGSDRIVILKFTGGKT